MKQLVREHFYESDGIYFCAYTRKGTYCLIPCDISDGLIRPRCKDWFMETDPEPYESASFWNYKRDFLLKEIAMYEEAQHQSLFES